MEPQAPTSAAGAFHVWLEDQSVVAAVWIWPEGYYWCQSWDTPELQAVALDAAAQWGITPASPPPDDMWGMLAWLRSVIPLGVRGGRNDGLVTSEHVPTDAPEELVRRLVCSGLDRPTALTTLTWPTLATDTVAGVPDPQTARLVDERLRVQTLQDAEANARAVQARQLRELEWVQERAEADAARHAADVARYADVVLTTDEFVNGIVDGAGEPHLSGWADALLDAVAHAGRRPRADGDFDALGGLLRTTVTLRRNGVDPFAGILEAPPVIHEWRLAFRDDFAGLTEQRNEVFRVVLHELAGSYYEAAGGPFRWGGLIEIGAWPVRPAAPDLDDW